MDEKQVHAAASDLFVALQDYGDGDESFRIVLDCADDLKAALDAKSPDPVPGLVWHKVSDGLPPLPSTPYKPYLVWYAWKAWDWGYGGTFTVAALCRQSGRFVGGDYDPRVHAITHWADPGMPEGADKEPDDEHRLVMA